MIDIRGPPSAPCYMGKATLKTDRYCPMVMQGFSIFFGLFQVIMVNLDIDSYTVYSI